jgi:hypothetical protein
LYKYLKRRADRHFRQPAGELNAILLELKEREDLETKQKGQVIRLVPDDQKGPLATQSGYRGVYPHGKQWMARATRDGHAVKLGVYATPEEAAQAYDDYIRQTRAEHGGHAPMNFPREGEVQATPPLDGGWPDEETRAMATQTPSATDLPDTSHLPEHLRRGLHSAGIGPDPEADEYTRAAPQPVPDPDVDPDPAS